jgi:hypothetical protein
MVRSAWRVIDRPGQGLACRGRWSGLPPGRDPPPRPRACPSRPDGPVCRREEIHRPGQGLACRGRWSGLPPGRDPPPRPRACPSRPDGPVRQRSDRPPRAPGLLVTAKWSGPPGRQTPVAAADARSSHGRRTQHCRLQVPLRLTRRPVCHGQHHIETAESPLLRSRAEKIYSVEARNCRETRLTFDGSATHSRHATGTDAELA